jgi:PPM family protein phosphatase
MLPAFKRAYDLLLWVKILTWLALLGCVLLLVRIAGGFPPPAWLVLAQSAPQLARLFSAHGLAALTPLAGLLVLSMTWAALWLLLAWTGAALLWRAWFPARRAARHAKNWQRTSLDNLLDSGYDEPQASLVYASTHASIAQTASPSTPSPDTPTRPNSIYQSVQSVGARVERTGGEGLYGRPPDNSVGARVERTGGEGLYGRPPGEARPHVGIGWDAGITRRQKPNEDSVLVQHATCTFRGQLAPLALFAVADGMGGHASGQVASHLATHSLMQTVLPSIQHGDELSEEFLIETMVNCAHWANQDIVRYREENAVDLGTTLTAALVVESTATIINVGDSRTYLYHAGDGLRQITRDHSVVARLVAAGVIAAEEVYTHPDRNKVYRGLGEKEEVKIDWFTEPVQPGDVLLLCSDGLWELVRDHEIEKILRRCLPDASQAAGALVKAALHRGGTDNISVIVARV